MNLKLYVPSNKNHPRTIVWVYMYPSLPEKHLSEVHHYLITTLYFILLQVPDETETKKLDPLKDEMDQLRTRNSELEVELAELEVKNGLLSKEIEDLKKDRITLIAETDAELGKKASQIAKKSADYKSLYDKMQQLQYEAQKQAEELHKLLKSQVHNISL